MQRFCVSHLSNPELTRGLASRIEQDRVHTAELLAYMAEFDARRLYLPAGYPSMRAYCMGELRLSEDAAGKRITVARASVQFPAILDFIADGRLHLSGAILLVPHLREETLADLLGAATHRTRAEIEQMVVERFPRNADDPITLELDEQSQPLTDAEHAPGRVEDETEHAPGRVGNETEPAPGRVDDESEHAPGRAGDGTQEVPAEGRLPHHRARITPIGPGLHELRATIGDAELERLRHAQNLLSHCVRPGDVTEVLRRALDALVTQLEKRRFAAASRPRAARSGARSPRTIPAHIRRAVWERDGGRCTFVSESGHRCEARDHLEFDHILEVARGGATTVENLRLLCRAHNQFVAEQTFGSGFMEAKRLTAKQARRAAQSKCEQESRAHRAGKTKSGTGHQSAEEIVPWLRSLGLRAADAQRAAESVSLGASAPLEDRVNVALAFHGAARLHRGERVSVTPPSPPNPPAPSSPNTDAGEGVPNAASRWSTTRESNLSRVPGDQWNDRFSPFPGSP